MYKSNIARIEGLGKENNGMKKLIVGDNGLVGKGVYNFLRNELALTT